MLIKNTLYIYLKLDLLNVYFKEEFIMKKLKFLAIFLFSAVIGLAGISKSSANSSDVIKSPDSKNAMYIPNGNEFTKYMSTSGLSQDILNDIKSSSYAFLVRKALFRISFLPPIRICTPLITPTQIGRASCRERV